MQNCFAERNLPYVYGSVKAKCYKTDELGTTKTCKKLGHSCLRGFVSFVHMPGKKYYRFACRAIVFLINQCWASFEIHDMSQAKKMIESEISLLSPPAGDNRCHMCSSALTCPAAFVGDAAQAFEAVSQERVLSAMHSLAALSKQLQQPDAIQISRKLRGGVCWGGSIKTPYTDRFIFTRLTLTKFVIVTLLMRWFVLGPW